jgi:hypothetical protein
MAVALQMAYTGLRDQSTHDNDGDDDVEATDTKGRSRRDDDEDDVVPLVPLEVGGRLHTLKFHAMVYVVLCSITVIILLSYYSNGGGAGGGDNDGSKSGESSTTGDDLGCIPVVLQGYDAVAYFAAGDDAPVVAATLGSALYVHNLHSADEDGTLRVYQFWFSSAANLQAFQGDPWAYAPQFGGFCTFGTCCEWADDDTGQDWPWAADYLGPPAGPDEGSQGYAIYNSSLYMMNKHMHVKTVFDDDVEAAAYVKTAEDRWLSWFGSLRSGVFNYNSMSTDDWFPEEDKKALYRAPQRKAPAVQLDEDGNDISSGALEACAIAPMMG